MLSPVISASDSDNPHLLLSGKKRTKMSSAFSGNDETLELRDNVPPSYLHLLGAGQGTKVA